MTAVIVLFGAITVAVVAINHYTRPCKHIGVTFHGLPSSAMVECRECGAIVEWTDINHA